MPATNLPIANLCGGRWDRFEHEATAIHMLRLIAMAINDDYQEAAKAALHEFEGRYEFRPAPIKGDARMRNKCVSVDDHRPERKPRPANNIDINRNLCTFDTAEDLAGAARALVKAFGVGFFGGEGWTEGGRSRNENERGPCRRPMQNLNETHVTVYLHHPSS